MLKQVIFCSCSSSRLITSGVVAASVACSMLGAVAGRSCCPEELLPCSCPTCPILAFQGAFLLPHFGIPGASVAVYVVAVVPNAVAAAAAGSAVAAAAAYAAYAAAALPAPWPIAVATWPLGVAPEATQLLHVMNSCCLQHSALLLPAATAPVLSPPAGPSCGCRRTLWHNPPRHRTKTTHCSARI